MDVRLKFRLAHPIVLEDCWPLEGYGAVLEFERARDEATAVLITFRNQPIGIAPRVAQLNEGPVQTSIEIRDHLGLTARHIVRRLSDYLNLYVFRFDVETEEFEVEYIPANAEERAQMSLYRFQSSFIRPKYHVPFSLLAQAFFAGEGPDDPSFAANLVKKAREALVSRDYIDAFRYSFLLFEALYGGGKFKTPDLVSELTSHADFAVMVETAMASFVSDPIHRKSKVREIASRYPTAHEMIKYLVTKRGFYFHGNLARPDAWHPGRQRDAKELAELTVELAGVVSSSLATAMFTPEVATRYLENAKRQGAIMPVHVKFNFLDDGERRRNGQVIINGPGTTLTNSIALEAHKSFLEWFQMEFPGFKLLSAIAHDKNSGMEIFRSEYSIGGRAPDQAVHSDPNST